MTIVTGWDEEGISTSIHSDEENNREHPGDNRVEYVIYSPADFPPLHDVLFCLHCIPISIVMWCRIYLPQIVFFIVQRYVNWKCFQNKQKYLIWKPIQELALPLSDGLIFICKATVMAEVVLIKDVECAVVVGVKWDHNWNNDEQQWRQQRRQQSSQTANHHLCKLWIVTQEKLARRLLTQCGLPGSSNTLKFPSPWTGLFLCINNSSTIHKRRRSVCGWKVPFLVWISSR